MYITGVVKEKDLEGTIIKEHFFFFSLLNFYQLLVKLVITFTWMKCWPFFSSCHDSNNKKIALITFRHKIVSFK